MLSTQQAAAVNTDSNRALVLAGAGSGKTRVLTARIRHLIKNKASPSEILAFTFTRKAAGEMKERLADVHGVKMGTMHGVALSILQRFGEYASLRPGRITVYSPWEESYLVRDVAMELGHHSGKSWKGVKKKQIDSVFRLFYETGTRVLEGEREANQVMDWFFARCRENNALTYGMILTKFLEILPEIYKFLRFRHILIDEVQDIDPLQWEIINRMCALCGATLFAVGDVDQSIFSFRGADPKYLYDNQDYFDTYPLETNYRSDKNIVELSNRLIKNNLMRISKTMKGFEDAQTPTELMKNMDSEAIKDLIIGLNETGPDARRAVLARNHFMLFKLSDLLNNAGFPHEYIGKKAKLTNSEPFRRFHALIKLKVNPYDNFSFLLIKDILGLDRDQYRSIRLASMKRYESHFQTWQKTVSPQNDLQKWLQSPVDDISLAVAELKEAELGFDTDEILTFVYSWMIENYTKTIRDYLEWLATYDIHDEIKDEDGVNLQLMTIHASKGLEWPTVIIAGMNEGILPSKHAFVNQEELESERRLAYVAMTRAMDKLVLTCRPDEEGRHPVSRFVDEAKGVGVASGLCEAT